MAGRERVRTCLNWSLQYTREAPIHRTAHRLLFFMFDYPDRIRRCDWDGDKGRAPPRPPASSGAGQIAVDGPNCIISVLVY